MRSMLATIGVIVGMLTLAGCATVGAPFQFSGPTSVDIGKTTEKEVLSRYGNPFRVGYEDGSEKWTYGLYHYRLFGDSDTKDLTFTFDRNGIVKSYSYSSSEPAEVKRALQN